LIADGIELRALLLSAETRGDAKRKYRGQQPTGHCYNPRSLPPDARIMIDQLLEFCGNHPLLVTGIVVAWLAVMVYEIRLKSQSFSHVSAAEAVRLMNAGAIVLDVRKPEEFAQGHIVNARNIEAETLGSDQKLLEKYKKKVVLTVCNSGLASNRAATQLRRQGVEQAFSIRGGIAAWKNDNMPLEK